MLAHLKIHFSLLQAYKILKDFQDIFFWHFYLVVCCRNMKRFPSWKNLMDSLTGVRYAVASLSNAKLVLIILKTMIKSDLQKFKWLGSLRAYGPLDPSDDFVLRSLQLLRLRDMWHCTIFLGKIKCRHFFTLHAHRGFSSPLHVWLKGICKTSRIV